MKSCRLSISAQQDFQDIYDYTLEEWGVDQFQFYREIINEALKALNLDPMMPGSKARDDLLSGCRFYHVGSHYIAYRISEEGIEVGRVLHENMDFPRHVEAQGFDEGDASGNGASQDI